MRPYTLDNMISKQLNTFQNAIQALVEQHRPPEAIDALRRKIAEAIPTRRDKATYASMLARLDTLDTNYTYLLNFLASGVADPGRENVYRSILAGILAVTEHLVVAERTADEHSAYCSTRRTLAMRPGSSIAAMLGQIADEPDRARAEGLRSDLFMRLWTQFPLPASDAEALAACFREQSADHATRSLAVSATMLGLLEQFDERRLAVLVDAYTADTDLRIKAAAIISILIALWRFGSHPISAKMKARIDAAADTPGWHSHLKAAYLELIRARDTERINRKMRDEILPRMMNLRPDILEKINDGSIDPADIEGLQENPQWQDLLDKSGISDRLKELTEIQLEGGDVMMSTFAGLKQFPFFANISNWFLPFDPAHTAVADAAGQAGVLASLLNSAPTMCDNDKYSSMLAMATLPQAQRDMMAANFRVQEQNIAEAMRTIDAELEPEQFRRFLNIHTQNLNRFFKLSPHHADFADPFASTINLLNVPALSADFDDAELVAVVAEFYFKLGYYDDAFDMFSRLDTIAPPDASRYQKMGYCMEQSSRPGRAADLYRRAEIFDPESLWTLRRLASVLRADGQADEALEAYRRLAQKQPDDTRTALLLGYCLMEKGLYEEAIAQFYKVDFLDDKTHKAWRPLAWTLFLARDFDRADQYYRNILSDAPRSNDYLNMGHVALARADIREAVNFYRLAVDTSDARSLDLRSAFAADASALDAAGVDPLLPPLVADAVARCR